MESTRYSTMFILCFIPVLSPACMQVPTEYFLLVLGKHLKYSSCLYPKRDTTLDDAELAMLGM